MRIISGKYGGRKIHPPAKMPHTRPTTDMAREGLFNILNNRIAFDGIKTLDLFGGTGAISYELASRGAESLTIVEKDANMYAYIKKNIELLGISGVQLLKMEVFDYLATASGSFDFIFAGPPYALTTIDEIPKLIIEKKLLAEDGYFVLEHTPRNAYSTYEGFLFQRNYGTTVFSFFSKGEK